LAGLKKMQTDHVLRTLCESGDGVDIQGGGVGRQNCAGLHHLVELFEHGFFDAHFLEHGFNDQVGVFQILVIQG